MSHASASLSDDHHPLKTETSSKRKKHPKEEVKPTSTTQQRTKRNTKAYMTVITTNREVDNSLVMLSSLFAMTKTIEKPVWERHRRSKVDDNTNVNSSDIDFVCLVLPKENIDDYNDAWKILYVIKTVDFYKFLLFFFLNIFYYFIILSLLFFHSDLGVSHLNIQKLIWAGCQVRPIPYPIMNPNYDLDDKSSDNDKSNDNDKNTKEEKEGSSEKNIIWEAINYNQIWIWSLEDHYETIIYIHHDRLILSNINHLFNRHEKYKTIPGHNNRPFIAAPANHLVTNQFDSGIMIIQPDTPLFQEMVHSIRKGEVGGLSLSMTSSSKNENNSLSTGSSINMIQKVGHFLNDIIFSDWFSMSPIHRLEPIYNAPYEWTFHQHTWLSHRTEIHIFHFTEYYKPVNIIANPKMYQISKYAAPFIYLWSLIMFFVTRPLVNLEEETRYALYEVFSTTLNSDDVLAYMERMKRGGTRRRRQSQTNDNSHSNDEL